MRGEEGMFSQQRDFGKLRAGIIRCVLQQHAALSSLVSLELHLHQQRVSPNSVPIGSNTMSIHRTIDIDPCGDVLFVFDSESEDSENCR